MAKKIVHLEEIQFQDNYIAFLRAKASIFATYVKQINLTHLRQYDEQWQIRIRYYYIFYITQTM